MKERTSQTIKVNREAYIYLLRIERSQRGCKPLTAESEGRIWQKMTGGGENQTVTLDDNSLGGGDGTYNGRWWSWSVETLKKMLTEAGIQYEQGKEKKYIDVR